MVVFLKTIIYQPVLGQVKMRSCSIQHVLLVGGGHAMLHTIRHIREKVPYSVKISLISDHPYLYYSGMVPEYLGGIYKEEEVRIDLMRLCKEFGIEWIPGKVINLNSSEMWVELDNHDLVKADLMAFDVGSVTPLSDQFQDYVVTKPLHRITHLMSTLQQMITNHTYQPIAIIGAGAAGVEIALNLGNRLKKEGLDTSIPIHLFEERDRVLPRFTPTLSESAYKALTTAGVTIHLKARPVMMDKHHLKVNETVNNYGVILWATGTVAPAFFLNSGLKTNQSGFVYTDAYMVAKDHPNIIVAGDSALVEGYETLERIGVHAVKQGPIVLSTLEARIFGYKPKKRFKPYLISPIIISSGSSEAWWVTPAFWLQNKVSLSLKHLVDRHWINPWLEGSFRHKKLWDYSNASGKFSYWK